MENAFHQLDDLVLRLKGLVLVRKVREKQGAAVAELAMYGAEIDRVRELLAEAAPPGGARRLAA
jgi:hypothetical protein